MNIQLSDHFTYGRLLRFTFPSMVMMIFTSIYSVVDGFFVSNFVGTTPFAAINILWPFLMICAAIGFMLGTGGSALVAKTLGEGKPEEANRIFSMLIYVSLALGVVIAILAIVFLRPISALLGAEGALLDNCVLYGRILLPTLPFFILQNEFQSFLVTAEKPGFGLAITVAAGLSNVALDALLVAIFPLGLVGAAVATAVSQVVGGLVPLLYFLFPNQCKLRLVKTPFLPIHFRHACLNGSSEFVTNISMSLVSMLYNVQLIKLAGENGVAAYGVVMYVSFLFVAVFLGYSIGSAPVISYHYGADHRPELHSLFRKSLVIVTILSVGLTMIAEVLVPFLSTLFVGYDPILLEMTVRAFTLYALSYLFTGFNIFGSAFFTALNDGFTSALISFLRTVIFQVAAVLLLPLVWELDGIWISAVAADIAAATVATVLLILNRKRYGYLDEISFTFKKLKLPLL